MQKLSYRNIIALSKETGVQEMASQYRNIITIATDCMKKNQFDT
jgi:hypothetical protein